MNTQFDETPSEGDMDLYDNNGLVCLDVFWSGKWVNLFKYAKHLEAKSGCEADAVRLINAVEIARREERERAARIAREYPFHPNVGQMISSLILGED